MEPNVGQPSLPNSQSYDLHLAHPTKEERIKIWSRTFASWGDSLELPEHLQQSLFLQTVPLSRNGGMTMWILVDKTLAPDQRPILCSCETYYKRSLVSGPDGKVGEAVVHGIASVFCFEEFRHRGYAARHMRELAKALHTWQSDKVVGSVLYSDIGRNYYAELGWVPNATNMHIEFPPVRGPKPSLVRDVARSDLPELCKKDETMIRSAMATRTPGARRLTILPDLDHMRWHIAKEDYATEYLFKKLAEAKGAIAGPPGKQVAQQHSIHFTPRCGG
ncbi:hypothetical protein O1611_g9023 [Lasiodiplodia mahajangana]|uniref:Uncharacterized protein n=1 Tax=Lasiodiplodia mahajangana TaxID=1108764 RepID=A0ACC2JBE8_9PEZI|nr:hypothetical protein O1611_g9023 [Lasiodiplodia mahajangana]